MWYYQTNQYAQSSVLTLHLKMQRHLCSMAFSIYLKVIFKFLAFLKSSTIRNTEEYPIYHQSYLQQKHVFFLIS